jgi:signal transduction histidine kinase
MEAENPVPVQGTILLVDDAPNNLRLLTGLLEEHGYDVRTVTSGASALKAVGLEPPDLILLDVAMPGMNGYEVCEKLRANPETRTIPVIFISALDGALDKVRAFDVGGVDYISKPFHAQEVLARVRTHLALRSTQRQLETQNYKLQQEITERMEAERQLQFLSHRLVEVQENERRAIAHELHEEVGQTLTGLNLSLEIVGSTTEDKRAARLSQAQRMVIDLIQQVREMSMHLRPPMLDDLGVIPALVWYFERYTAQTNIQVALQHTGMERRFTPDIEVSIYRIVQEALTNVARHANVSNVSVQLHTRDHRVIIQIEDQGTGFDPSFAQATSATSGLASIRERVRLLGGQVDIHSAPGQGSTLAVELPLNPHPPYVRNADSP